MLIVCRGRRHVDVVVQVSEEDHEVGDLDEGLLGGLRVVRARGCREELAVRLLNEEGGVIVQE